MRDRLRRVRNVVRWCESAWQPRARPKRRGSCRGALEGGGGSRYPTAEAGRQDVELLAVLRHGAACDLEALFMQLFRDGIVRKRISFVLLVDQRLDDVLGRTRRTVFAILVLEPGGEEELELEHA